MAQAGGPESGWRTPSARFGALRRAQLAVTALPAVVAALVLGTVSGAPAIGGVAAGAVAVVAVAIDVALERRVRSWSFSERDEDLLVRRGVMFRRESVIPYGRMQYVDVTAGPFERLFGLASVRMHTAAAASDARIPALPAEEAARLRDQLSRLGESHLAGL